MLAERVQRNGETDHVRLLRIILHDLSCGGNHSGPVLAEQMVRQIGSRPLLFGQLGEPLQRFLRETGMVSLPALKLAE